MNFEINSLTMVYQGGAVREVQVVFRAHTPDYNISVSGNYNLTAEEYEGNESLSRLQSVVRQGIADKLTNAVPEGA